jgi:uncharacterized RDD family membrane protein YckC
LNTIQIEYAGPGRRLAALLIDATLVAAVGTGALLAWMTVSGAASETHTHAVQRAAAVGAFSVLVLKVMLDAWMQGTPGLRLMDCRLVDARSGRAIGLGRSALRAIGLILAILPGMLGLLWMFWNKRRQGWHDLLAGSVVIREDESLKSLHQLEREAR